MVVIGKRRVAEDRLLAGRNRKIGFTTSVIPDRSDLMDCQGCETESHRALAQHLVIVMPMNLCKIFEFGCHEFARPNIACQFLFP